jgi:hypothetical protein
MFAALLDDRSSAAPFVQNFALVQFLTGDRSRPVPVVEKLLRPGAHATARHQHDEAILSCDPRRGTLLSVLPIRARFHDAV